MPEQRKSIVIHSPHSGRATELTQALEYLRQAGIEPAQVISIADLDTKPAQGIYWQEQGIDIAIAAGGDGLVGGVISHIASSGPILGILPLGTSNDIARSLRLPLDLSRAVETIAQGQEREIDIGAAHPAEQAPHLASAHQKGPIGAHIPSHKRGFFAHALTIGLNVQFARLATSATMRQRYGRMTYPLVALEAFKNHEALEVELHFKGLAPPETPLLWQRLQLTPAQESRADDAIILRSKVLQVTVINAPIFGGAWQLAIPGASITDGLLDIVVIEDIAFGDISTALVRLFGSKEEAPGAQNDSSPHHPAEITGIPGIHHLRTKGVTITTNADPRDVTLDGEVRGQTPIYTHIADERLRVIVPADAP